MRALKALVIVMGVLIVIGLGVVVVTIVKRSARLADSSSTTSFGRTDVAVPPGSRVVETAVDGHRLVLRLTLADGRDRLLVVDLRTGREAGTIDLTPRPPDAAGK